AYARGGSSLLRAKFRWILLRGIRHRPPFALTGAADSTAKAPLVSAKGGVEEGGRQEAWT
ncbi:hypothetical protein, partial [Corynebacterium marquesiae]|uniref:hypothetical protein n=1 Tax=Corynebacterium marquesiae TaxID=2913503 RepID=UPI00254F2472